MKSKRARSLIALAGVAMLASSFVASPAGAEADPTLVLFAPKEIEAKYPLPYTGTKVATFSTPATMKAMVVTPDRGTINAPVKYSGSGLEPNTKYDLVWATSEAAWKADVDPTTANYRGYQANKINVLMGSVTTDATGAYSYSTKIPADFGGTHEIYVVKDSVGVAKGGYQIDRTVSISPKSGPVGTPITITYTGLGASLYTAGGSVNYDNKYAGQMMALWTRGMGKAVIRASGKPGDHYIQVADAITFMYMNILQSPVPQANGDVVKFRVTKDAGLIKPYAVWPEKVVPTVSARTTFDKAGSYISKSGMTLNADSKAVATLAKSEGPVLSKNTITATDLSVSGNVDLYFSTVVGSRVDCPPGSTQCWKFNPIKIGTGTVVNGKLSQEITIPDNLGGYHVIQIAQNNKIEAQVPFYVHASLVEIRDKNGKLVSTAVAKADNSPAALPAGVGAGSYKFKQGEEFTISVKGVGWTQFDNTMAVTYDNSLIGYGCGFNSNGYMAIHLIATGDPGTHIIDLWPQYYTNQPSFANANWGMAPLLSSGWDTPALALGYKLPSLHFSITVTK